MSEQACHREACDIQNCIQKNTFNQQKCESLIDKLNECCQKYYQQNGSSVQPLACPTPARLNERIENRKK